jgi:hypothetical protein
MKGIGEAAKTDSGAMRPIAVVTIAFLPLTFIAVGPPCHLSERMLIKAGDLQHELLQLQSWTRQGS